MIRFRSWGAIGVGTGWLFSAVSAQSFPLCGAQPNDQGGDALPLTRAHAAGVTVRKTLNTTVSWEGRKYSAAEGIPVLMEIITDGRTDPSVRAKALDRVGRLGSRLRDTDRIPELIALYDNLCERDEKGALLLCLSKAEDPAGLPLFVQVLDQEDDKILRLLAAGSLAEWNMRRGVSELARLLDSQLLLPNRSTLGTEALKLFQGSNRRKGWGCPVEETRKSVEQSCIRDPKERTALYVRKIKEWFAENKERFPVWNLGDPLPERPAVEKDDPGSEGP